MTAILFKEGAADGLLCGRRGSILLALKQVLKLGAVLVLRSQNCISSNFSTIRVLIDAGLRW